MFLEFSKLGLDCSLNISPAHHDTTSFPFGLNLFQLENGFLKKSLRLRKANDFHKFMLGILYFFDS
jgi:hypothetical protein